MEIEAEGFDASVALSWLQKRGQSIEELGEIDDDGEMIGVLLARKRFKMSEEEEMDLGRLINETQLYGYTDSKNTEFQTALPPALLVKKMLGRDAASAYRVLLEDAEAASIQMNYKDPYPLVNKSRLKKIIRDLEELVESQM